ncbi:energy-coupling factor ABC transporter ATP-binding protein [Halanaerobaculum tunisiense]
MSKPVIEVKDVEFSYQDGTEVLQNLSLTIPQGERIAILGPNGAGKSTLFLHLNGILQPQQGEILFEGERVNYDQKSLTELRKKVGIVFQEPDKQLFSADVRQEISFGPLNLGLSQEEVKKQVYQIMETMGISNLKDKPVQQLSYGQKKKVSIADVLVMEPEVIIFDEPTVWLDPQATEEIIALFRQLQQSGITVVIATHDVNLAYSWADYTYIMKQGRMVGQGKPEKVFQDQQLLTEANLIQPWIIEVYNRLETKGLLNGESIPRSKEELLGMIEK